MLYIDTVILPFTYEFLTYFLILTKIQMKRSKVTAFVLFLENTAYYLAIVTIMLQRGHPKFCSRRLHMVKGDMPELGRRKYEV